MKWTSPIGQQIYDSLPALYRTRDSSGDLAAYLDACGELLDALQALVGQRLADSFPSHEQGQTWVIPYFADLLGVPPGVVDEETLRIEINQTLRWRKMKGTLPCVREIVDAIGQLRRAHLRSDEVLEKFVAVREGRERVACTARPPEPLPHPGEDESDWWTRQLVTATAATAALTKGPPYDDWKSLRLMDGRTISATLGHAHPRSVLVFVPRDCGFFFKDWQLLPDKKSPEWKELAPEGNERNGGSLTIRDQVITDPLPISTRLTLTNCILRGELSVPAEDAELTLTDCILDGTLSITAKRGRVTAVRCAIESLLVRPPSDGTNQDLCVTLKDSLLRSIDAQGGTTELLGATVLGTTQISKGCLHASDCLFAGSLTIAGSAEAKPCRIRYSRIPATLSLPSDKSVLIWRQTTADPEFLSTEWASASCGALSPGTSPELLKSAEDGGELGAYACHSRLFTRRIEAITAKLAEYLPVGSRVMVIPTEKLPESASALP